MKLQNKIAVITGGNSGIGLATAKELKAHGARVIIIGRNKDAVNAAAKEIGGDTLGITADVSRVADIEHAMKIIGEKAGHIDVLYVNAGVAKFAPVTDSTEAMFDEMMNINVKGAYFTMQRALPLLADGASVIFTSSSVANFGMPGASIYGAGKAALNNLVKTLALELAAKKIRVNVVSPGPIATPIFGKMGMDQAAQNEVGAAILKQVPLARFGSSEEIGRAVLFLASSDSSYMTGQELCVDGGMALS